MSEFARFGIDHLSHSMLSDWAQSPGMWVLKRLYGWKDDKMYAAKRGQSVEVGFGMLAHGAQLQMATDAAKHDYRERVAGEINEQIEKEAGMIAPMLMRLGEWVENNKPEIAAQQIRIKTSLPGLDDIDLVGYIDFGLLSGVDMDLKSTGRRPDNGAARPSHLRQMSIYWEARDRPQQLLYVTPRETIHIELVVTDLVDAWDETVDIAHQLNNWLKHMPSKRAALECAHFDFDNRLISEEAKQFRDFFLTQLELEI